MKRLAVVLFTAALLFGFAAPQAQAASDLEFNTAVVGVFPGGPYADDAVGIQIGVEKPIHFGEVEEVLGQDALKWQVTLTHWESDLNALGTEFGSVERTQIYANLVADIVRVGNTTFSVYGGPGIEISDVDSDITGLSLDSDKVIGGKVGARIRHLALQTEGKVMDIYAQLFWEASKAETDVNANGIVLEGQNLDANIIGFGVQIKL